MTRYIVRRLFYLMPLWLAVSLLAFSLLSVARGDPASTIWYRDHDQPPSSADLDGIRAEEGLDDPFPVRYGRWLAGAFQGDLGRSYKTGEPVFGALRDRFPATLELAGAALLFALVLALPLGIVAAVYRNSLLDHMARLGALLGASMPSFWLAYLLISVFSVRLGLLPVSGKGGLDHLILPASALGMASAAILSRLTRSALLEVLGEDYIRTARAKGLRENIVILRHALKVALIPVVTVIGLNFGYLLGGAVIIEHVFAWPGIGRLAVAAIFDRDYPVIQGFVLYIGGFILLVNLIVDISYAWLDPRVRLGGSLDAAGATR